MEIVEKRCPRCGEECQRDSANVGVGILYGPWGCPNCGWSEWEEYDRSNKGRRTRSDQYGGTYPNSTDKLPWEG